MIIDSRIFNEAKCMKENDMTGEQTWFVSSNSLLYPALMQYFHHINPKRSFEQSAHKFVRGYHDSPDHDGFIMTTGCGYDINDEFFAGLKSNQKINDGVGSGIPTRRFLKYLNSDVKD